MAIIIFLYLLGRVFKICIFSVLFLHAQPQTLHAVVVHLGVGEQPFHGTNILCKKPSFFSSLLVRRKRSQFNQQNPYSIFPFRVYQLTRTS